MNKNMTVPNNALTHLRPRRLGELIDLTMRLYRQNFLSFVGIIALVLIPTTLFQLIISLITLGTSNPNLQPVDITDLFVGSGANIFVTCIFLLLNLILVQGLGTAALTYLVAQNYLGNTIGIIDAYKAIKDVWLRLVFAFISIGLVTFVGLLLSFIPFIGWLFGLVLAWGACIFIWVVIMPVMVPVIVLEQQTITGAIGRSWDLTRRRFWWVLGYVIVLYIFRQVVVVGPVSLINLGLVIFLDSTALFFILQIITQTLVSLISTLLYLPLQLAAITLLYFDLCIYTEGLDLALYLRSEINTETSAETSTNNYIKTIATVSPSSGRGNLLTWPEVGKFFLISLIIGGLYFSAISVAFGLFGLAGF